MTRIFIGWHESFSCLRRGEDLLQMNRKRSLKAESRSVNNKFRDYVVSTALRLFGRAEAVLFNSFSQKIGYYKFFLHSVKESLFALSSLLLTIL